jgi:tRNA-(ms[2]io[6]A)-hydroxylase
MIRLRCESPKSWLEAVLADFDTFLLDHAACERKASAMAMHLAAHYRDRPVLVDAMVDLACEELDHFRQVYRIARDRGLELSADEKDEYVNAMNATSRRGSAGYFLDRLLIAGIVEARGCERFGLVAQALGEGSLKSFYLQITRSESRHADLFVELAREYFPESQIEERQALLLDAEAQVVARLPIRAGLH